MPTLTPSSPSSAPIANSVQKDYWSERVGQTWIRLQGMLDHQIDGLGLAAMDRLALKPGERVLDIGCGCGQTSFELADRVGANGAVTAVDISRPMLDVAGAKPPADGSAPVHFIEADAQTETFAEGAYDAVFSRFGVMFFQDPEIAFANIRRALKPDGRMAFVCWRTLADNAWMSAPSEAAAHIVPRSPPSDPYAPGPFAFADADRVESLLSDAGFVDTTVLRHDALISAGSLENQITLAFHVGPLASALRDKPELASQLDGPIRAAMAAYQTPSGDMAMPASCWIFMARNPGT